MNTCFFGVGGVGGYYGALLTRYCNRTGRGRTCFIARGRHKDAILKKGLLLKKDGGKEEIRTRPQVCSDRADDLPVFDVVVVSVKGYDLDDACKQTAGITDENSIILPLLNGADIYERVRRHVTKGYVLPSCVYLSTRIESPGVIFQKGGSCRIAVGKDPSHPGFYPGRLIDLFRNAGILIDFFEDVDVEIWTKYIFIAPFALVTAAYDKTIGEAANDPRLGALVKNIMQEIASIAGALRVSLPPGIVESSFSKAGQFPFETKTSFQRDVETKGGQSEWDLFGQTVVRYAQRLDVPADHTQATLEKLLNEKLR